ncbi:MAG: lysylphosphatidylglycerol synthase domain-containing protein [Phoenicibacter congonensis]|uniref:Lysylphosphatidylglycerol synthase domain-containing protein n=1 Tax=Phoenicibacter congonensis TaxID=1944646 RepID=A0AA43RIU3_9ACTN|nr:lysylphosphatidylglycerol synthase domain-containing protein [Phoenicibacter congonensis]
MKKAILIIVGIVAVCALIANADFFAIFLDTMATGSLIPLVIAVILMLARHFIQALSYDAAFEAVGQRTGIWHNIVLIFSLVFINTFCLFSGATGVAFIIDDAHREGLDAGQSTGGAILSQIGYFAAVFVISVLGFTTMMISGHTNTMFIIGGLVLAMVLVFLSSLFFFGHFKPRMLYRVFFGIEAGINKLLGIFKKSLRPAWGRKMAHSMIRTSNLLAKNPKGAAITVAWASLSAVLNMACLVAIGYAFGFEHTEGLIAAFAVAAISVLLSPTPQGVGVVEAAIIAILSIYGCPIGASTAIALVYRGIMFWVPFAIGAVLLSQSGFFKSDKSESDEQRARDIAWIMGTLVFIVGGVNISMTFFPSLFIPFTMLTSWIDMSVVMVGIPLVLVSLVLVLCAIGLVLRIRTAWAIAMTILMTVGGWLFLFSGTWQVGFVSLFLATILFWQREVFDRPFDAIRVQQQDSLEWEEKAKRGEEIRNRYIKETKNSSLDANVDNKSN